jgi:hypothetical protein
MNRPHGEATAEDRKRAVDDVLAGMPPFGAAVVWGVLTADLERWVEEAKTDAEQAKDGQSDAAAG